MAKVKVVINQRAANALRNSPEMQSGLLEIAERIAASANSTLDEPGYEADVQAGRTRAHAMVKAVSWEAKASNAKHNTLLKRIGDGS